MKLLTMILFLAQTLWAQGIFYRQYWADFSHEVSNHHDGRWRVNDPALVLHPEFGKRGEARANGLALLNVPEDLFGLEKAVLYLEMWGGHPHTSDKRVTVNGKASYPLGDFGASEGHCVYAYPQIEIAPQHLVNGVNALQFSCDRGTSFWGHFIIDNIALRCVLRSDSLFARQKELVDFSARVVAPETIDRESAALRLDLPAAMVDQVIAVDFFARYSGFDDNGDGKDDDWHGYTFKRQFVRHLGRAQSAPFSVVWNTEMIPDQSKPIQFKAVVQLADGLFYETEPTPGSLLVRKKETVQLFYCYDAPVPFWSRAGNLMTGTIRLPVDVKKIVKAQLQVKIWDGGEGEVQEPFKINGRAYPITSQKAIHDVVHTAAAVAPAHLRSGENVITVLSDTDHHGIEVLRPGPCLILRMKK